MLARILTGARGDLRGQEAKDKAVLVCGPNRAITFQKTRSGALLSSETARAVEQARRKPFKDYRHLPQFALEAVNHTIDQATADECLTNNRRDRPLGTVREEIPNRDCKIVIWIQKTRRRRDNSVPISIWIVAECDVETILELDKPCHCPGARAIHPDFSIMIDSHEWESRIDLRVHYGDIDPVAFPHRLPITHRCASQRIDTDFHTSGANGLHIDHMGKVLHIASDKVLGMGCRGLEGRIETDALNTFVTAAQ